MKSLGVFALVACMVASSGYAQKKKASPRAAIAASAQAATPTTAPKPAEPTVQAGRVHAAAQGEPELGEERVLHSETLRYAVNWPSGLSLGEAQLGASRLKTPAGERWKLSFRMDAAIPGFSVLEDVKSTTNADFCTVEYEKKVVRGKKNVNERTEFDTKKLTATRTTHNGGKSEISTSACAKDAVSFLHFLRHELAQGRLPAQQAVYYGAAYQTRVEFKGSQPVKLQDGTVQADKIVGTIKGPASESTFEIFFAKDAIRTPLILSVPLTLGKFSMEIVR
jgi:hypothetical protein